MLDGSDNQSDVEPYDEHQEGTDPDVFIKNWINGKYNPREDELPGGEPALPGSCMALVLNNDNVPRSWRQAINTPEWEKAMEREINELENKQAWEIVPRPAHEKVLPGVRNFRIKKDENVIKYKARWCVDGSREGFLRPPENVFAPVAELSTIRMLIAIAAAGNHAVLQADFPNASVNAEIGEDVYATQPKGLESKDPSKYICKLKKALYCCSISGKRWNEVLSSAILSLGYKRYFIDHCLFHRERDGHKEMLIIYVEMMCCVCCVVCAPLERSRRKRCR